MQAITRYANEQLWEEEWQKEYKYGVILFIPPESLFSSVNQLRQKYDKFSADGCCAHISLTMPLKNPLTMENINQIEKNYHISKSLKYIMDLSQIFFLQQMV